MKSIYTNGNSIFPSQVVSDAEKASWEYGEQVAQAIEQEWFSQGRTNGNRYLTTWNNYNILRLYHLINYYNILRPIGSLLSYNIKMIVIIYIKGEIFSKKSWS